MTSNRPSGVNAAAFRYYWLRGHDRTWTHAAIPITGFVVCAYIWMSLRSQAKWAGLLWIVIGCLYMGGMSVYRRRVRNVTE